MKRAFMLALVTLSLQGCGGDTINAPALSRAVLPTPVPPGPMPSAVPDTNRPPVLAVNLSPGAVRGVVTGRAPLVLNASLCGSSDPEGDQISFRYMWGDHTDHSSFSCQQNHTYAAAGSYGATFCVYDRPEFHVACHGFTVLVSN